MCVIIYNPKGNKIQKSILQNSARINPDGAGVYWLDSGKLEYFPSDQFKKLYKARPFIAHFRFATVGAVTDINRQPVKFTNTGKPYLFFHNGTVEGIGDTIHSDSFTLANSVLSQTNPKAWAVLLSTYDSRFAAVQLGRKEVQIFNRSDWTESGGVLYSKANVLNSHKVAVYGTLRKGNSNYNHYLTKSKYIGQGETLNSYLMTCPSSIPFVHPEPNPSGSNIVVDVFEVNSSTLAALDMLEGHPHWYCREQTDIVLDSGESVRCWVYFNEMEDFVSPYLSDYNTRSKTNFNSFQYFDSENIEDEQYCFDCYSDLATDPHTEDAYCPNCFTYQPSY